MNERIQQIAEKAGYHPDVYELCKPGMEKFAELMVKEFITICTPDISGRLDGRPYETADDFDRGFIDGQDCCVELIKKHFGVKE